MILLAQAILLPNYDILCRFCCNGTIVCIRVSPPSFLPNPPQIWKLPEPPPFLGNSPLYIGFSVTSLKSSLSLNISDFSLFFMKKLHPSPQKKVTTSFSATPLSKLRSCQAYPFSKIWWEAQPHRPSPHNPPHTMETE